MPVVVVVEPSPLQAQASPVEGPMLYYTILYYTYTIL